MTAHSTRRRALHRGHAGGCIPHNTAEEHELDLVIDMFEQLNAALDGGWLPVSHLQSFIAKYIMSITSGETVAIRRFATAVLGELHNRRLAHHFHQHMQEIRSREQSPLPHPEPVR